MKPFKAYLTCILAASLSLFSLQTSAVTIADGTEEASEQRDAQSIKRTKLIKRYAEGKIETDKGTFYTSGAEVIDHRPIDNWYQSDSGAEVSLYFEGKRLIQVVIY